MINVDLSKGAQATVCAAGYEIIKEFKWSLHSGGYAVRASRGDMTYMHREVISAPKGVEVDHINGDRLDNRISNLRIASRGQNARNVGVHKDSRSGYCGVTRSRSRINPWYASIMNNGKRHYLGYFKTPEEAAHAYDNAAVDLHGEFARLNFESTTNTSGELGRG